MIGEKMEDGFVEVAKQAMEPPAKELGTQLASLLNLIFTPLQMAQIYRDAWIEDYKRRINSKYQKIPSEQIQEPPLNIIGPAIEASKYHIATEEMREMFANLVAHSCDKRMASALHPSFVTILTQISPVEANILSEFRPKKEFKIGVSFPTRENGQNIPEPELSGTGVFSFPERVQPIANYYLANGNQRFLVQANVIQSDIATIEEVSSAVTNLIRLGLIDVDFHVQITKEAAYDYFSRNDLYQVLQKDIQPGNQVFWRTIRGNLIMGGEYKEIRIERGIVRLTQFGYDFTKICMIEKEVINEGDRN